MGLCSRLDLAQERLSELDDLSMETSKTERQREKRLEKNIEQNIQELWTAIKCVTYTYWEYQILIPPRLMEPLSPGDSLLGRFWVPEIPQ